MIISELNGKLKEEIIMSKVLYIKANPKTEGSRTFKISDEFVNEYKKNNPNDEVVTLDLYNEDIDFLKLEDFGVLFSEKNSESRNNELLKYAYQFQEADKYIFSAPMWNLGFPAILKAYIDYVSVSGITFKYTSEGAVGLCTGKKALYVTSSGSIFSTGPLESFEMGARYIKTILGFFGVYDVEVLAAEGVDMGSTDTDETVESAINKGKEIAKKF